LSLSVRALPAAVVVMLLVACSETGEDLVRSSPATRPSSEYLYVAIGASETVGAGSAQPLRDAWPQVLFRTALPAGTTFVNLGIPGTTVAGALQRELSYTLDLRPDLVTVWLNVNDLVAGVTPEEYERELDRLVSRLRAGGVERVLVANTPPLTNLPAYRACRPDPPPGGPPCLDRSLPPPAILARSVDAYNAAIRRVAGRQGAKVVDLHARTPDGALALRGLVSSDGFHPSTSGHRVVASAFADALRRAGGAG
jgi:acyl-CoA thioesterase I